MMSGTCDPTHAPRLSAWQHWPEQGHAKLCDNQQPSCQDPHKEGWRAHGPAPEAAPQPPGLRRRASGPRRPSRAPAARPGRRMPGAQRAAWGRACRGMPACRRLPHYCGVPGGAAHCFEHPHRRPQQPAAMPARQVGARPARERDRPARLQHAVAPKAGGPAARLLVDQRDQLGADARLRPALLGRHQPVRLAHAVDDGVAVQRLQRAQVDHLPRTRSRPRPLAWTPTLNLVTQARGGPLETLPPLVRSLARVARTSSARSLAGTRRHARTAPCHAGHGLHGSLSAGARAAPCRQRRAAAESPPSLSVLKCI